MTSDEIKRNVAMSEVVRSYGISINNKGMCCCPFHGDKHPSMKIYKDSYYCFTCQESGDVFTFTQKMDKCTFPTAFLKLGGEYEHIQTSPRAKRVAEVRRTQQKSKVNSDQKQEDKLKEMMAYNLDAIRTICEAAEPMSDLWCFAQQLLPVVEEQWEQYQVRKEEVIKTDVLGINRRIRQRINAL